MYTSNYMFAFLGGGAGHGKMSLNSIYTANYMIFRGVSLENVSKIPCTHQITCFCLFCLFFLDDMFLRTRHVKFCH